MSAPGDDFPHWDEDEAKAGGEGQQLRLIA